MDGFKGYWKRRSYQRLDGNGRRRRKTVELGGGGGGGRRRFWKIRISPRLSLLRRFVSPKRILSRIRDAYVRMMLSFASSGAFASVYAYGGESVLGFGRPTMKEYDEKVLVEIYKTILAKGNHFADGSGGGGQQVGSGGGSIAAAGMSKPLASVNSFSVLEAIKDSLPSSSVRPSIMDKSLLSNSLGVGALTPSSILSPASAEVLQAMPPGVGVVAPTAVSTELFVEAARPHSQLAFGTGKEMHGLDSGPVLRDPGSPLLEMRGMVALGAGSAVGSNMLADSSFHTTAKPGTMHGGLDNSSAVLGVDSTKYKVSQVVFNKFKKGSQVVPLTYADDRWG